MEDKCKCPCVNYVLRLALGGVLLVMGINKFGGGVTTFVDNTMAMFDGSILPGGIVKAFLTAVPLVEVVLGALILLGLWLRHAAVVTAFLFAFFAVGLTAAGNMDLMQGITNNFIHLFVALFLVKKSCPTPLSLDKVLNTGGKCDTK